MRFHGLITAAAVGTPLVPLARQAKLARLARRLGDRALQPSAPPVHRGEQLLVAAAVLPAPEAVRPEVVAADERRRRLRFPNLEADIGAAAGLALRPLEWIL